MVVFFWLEFVAGRFCFVSGSCSMYFVCSFVVGLRLSWVVNCLSLLYDDNTIFQHSLGRLHTLLVPIHMLGRVFDVCHEKTSLSIRKGPSAMIQFRNTDFLCDLYLPQPFHAILPARTDYAQPSAQRRGSFERCNEGIGKNRDSANPNALSDHTHQNTVTGQCRRYMSHDSLN
jgi:hypothetical protein